MSVVWPEADLRKRPFHSADDLASITDHWKATAAPYPIRTRLLNFKQGTGGFEYFIAIQIGAAERTQPVTSPLHEALQSRGQVIETLIARLYSVLTPRFPSSPPQGRILVANAKPKSQNGKNGKTFDASSLKGGCGMPRAKSVVVEVAQNIIRTLRERRSERKSRGRKCWDSARKADPEGILPLKNRDMVPPHWCPSQGNLHSPEHPRVGGCCSMAGRVSFSTELSAAASAFRKKIVAHKLLDLKVSYHGRLFKALLKSYLESKRFEEFKGRLTGD